MRITLEPTTDQSVWEPHCQQHKVVVETLSDDLDIHDVMENVRSALLAWGFAPKSIDEYIPVS